MFTYVVMDLEATGLDCYAHRVISIAGKVLNFDPRTRESQFNDREVINTAWTFRAFINPFQQNYAIGINHISEDLLQHSPSFIEVIEDFWKWVSKIYESNQRQPIVFIGHNYDMFDEAMLLAEHTRAKCNYLIPATIPMFKMDTMKLAKLVFPYTAKSIPYKISLQMSYPDSYRQVDLYQYLFGKEPDHQHDALGDVHALEDILLSSSFQSLLKEATPDNSRLESILVP